MMVEILSCHVEKKGTKMIDLNEKIDIDDLDRLTAILSFGTRASGPFTVLFDDINLPNITQTIEVIGCYDKPMGKFEVTIRRVS